MIVKKLAIRNKIRFTRVPFYMDSDLSICEDQKCVFQGDYDIRYCKHDCPIIYKITGTGKFSINFGYVVKEKDRPE